MKTVIGITGAIGSGKDTGAEYIGSLLNLPVFQISHILKEKVKEAGLPLSRISVMEMGNKVAKEFGEDYLAKKNLEFISDVGIISGFRQLAQLDYLKAHSRFILISVEADPKIRYERILKRNTLLELPTFEGFLHHELSENSGDNPRRLFDCMARADYHVNNEGDLELFHAQLKDILVKEKLISDN